MQRNKVKAAIMEATRFIGKATELLRMHESPTVHRSGTFPRESGATRRASLDLTRSLAEMRKP